MAFTLDNFVRSTLQADITAGSTTITVTLAAPPLRDPPDATPTAPGLLVLQDAPASPTKIEVISYTGRSIVGTVVTLTGVTRGLEGTTDSPWVAGTPTFQGITASVIAQKLDASGTAAKATQLETARTIALGGLLGGSASFDGSGNVTITATMADGALSIAKVGGLQTALDAKTTPSAVATQISTAINALINGSPGALDTLNELAAAMGDDPNFAATMTNALALKAPLNSPQFTGTVGLPSTGTTVGGDFGLIYSSAPGAVSVRSGVTGAVYFNFGNNGYFNALNGGGVFAGTVTATDHINSSDERLKHAIAPFDADAHLADVLELVTWLWNSDESRAYGLIAQKAQKICPRYVSVGEDGMLGIDKAGIALEAVIGLASRVRKLEALA